MAVAARPRAQSARQSDVDENRPARHDVGAKNDGITAEILAGRADGLLKRQRPLAGALRAAANTPVISSPLRLDDAPDGRREKRPPGSRAALGETL
jgi:hypothetical protein